MTTDNKPKKNKHVKAWMHEHVTDHYVNKAHADGYRSRAAYKLLEIDDEENLFRNSKFVVDLGCTPGSWSQVAVKKVGLNGIVIGMDLLEMEPLPGLHFIQGDFSTDESLEKLVQVIDNNKVDLVISDMAPNMSGIRNVDQARSSYLVELVLDFCQENLRHGGNCLIKLFHGGEFNTLVNQARGIFNKVSIKKPNASRSRSSEVFLLCQNKK